MANERGHRRCDLRGVGRQRGEHAQQSLRETEPRAHPLKARNQKTQLVDRLTVAATANTKPNSASDTTIHAWCAAPYLQSRAFS